MSESKYLFCKVKTTRIYIYIYIYIYILLRTGGSLEWGNGT